MTRAAAARFLLAEQAGQRLKNVREKLNLRFRDVEEASHRIAAARGSDEFTVGLSRLADIENKGTVPSIYRLYTLCAIYRLEPAEVMSWYGIQVENLAADSRLVDIEDTHPVRLNGGEHGDVLLPLSLDPHLALEKTSFLTRAIQRWGKLPIALLNSFDLKSQSYGYIGTDDWTMYPLLQPGSFVMIDETQREIETGGWKTEFERPIYFMEHRDGYSCGWCSLSGDSLVVQPHPASGCSPMLYSMGVDVEVLGRICGIAMRLDSTRRRNRRA